MIARVFSVALLLSVAPFFTGRLDPLRAAPAPKSEKPTAKEIEKAQEQIKEKFAPLQNRGAPQLVHVADEPVGRAFPKFLILTAIFRKYPIARVPPEPLNRRMCLSCIRTARSST